MKGTKHYILYTIFFYCNICNANVFFPPFDIHFIPQQIPGTFDVYIEKNKLGTCVQTPDFTYTFSDKNYTCHENMNSFEVIGKSKAYTFSKQNYFLTKMYLDNKHYFFEYGTDNALRKIWNEEGTIFIQYDEKKNIVTLIDEGKKDYVIGKDGKIATQESNEKKVLYTLDDNNFPIYNNQPNTLSYKKIEGKIYSLEKNNTIYLVSGSRRKKILSYNNYINDFSILGEDIYILSEDEIIKYIRKTNTFSSILKQKALRSFGINNEFLYYTVKGELGYYLYEEKTKKSILKDKNRYVSHFFRQNNTMIILHQEAGTILHTNPEFELRYKLLIETFLKKVEILGIDKKHVAYLLAKKLEKLNTSTIQSYELEEKKYLFTTLKKLIEQTLQ